MKKSRHTQPKKITLRNKPLEQKTIEQALELKGKVRWEGVLTEMRSGGTFHEGI
jgi:hypothetical protein